MVTRRGFEPLYDSVKGCCVKPLHQRAKIRNMYGAVGETRTRTGRPATPSRWCVCQFHHDRNYEPIMASLPGLEPGHLVPETSALSSEL